MKNTINTLINTCTIHFLYKSSAETTGWLKSFESKNERMCIF